MLMFNLRHNSLDSRGWQGLLKENRRGGNLQELADLRRFQDHVIVGVILSKNDCEIRCLIRRQPVLVWAEPLLLGLLKGQEHLQVLQRVRRRGSRAALALRAF